MTTLSGPQGSEERSRREPPRVPCRDCGATVLLVPTEKSGGARRMPIDVDPVPDGLCFLVDDDQQLGWWVRVIGYRAELPAELATHVRYTSHMGTCPRGGDRWVRARRRPGGRR